MTQKTTRIERPVIGMVLTERQRDTLAATRHLALTTEWNHSFPEPGDMMRLSARGMKEVRARILSIDKTATKGSFFRFTLLLRKIGRGPVPLLA